MTRVILFQSDHQQEKIRILTSQLITKEHIKIVFKKYRFKNNYK